MNNNELKDTIKSALGEALGASAKTDAPRAIVPDELQADYQPPKVPTLGWPKSTDLIRERRDVRVCNATHTEVAVEAVMAGMSLDVQNTLDILNQIGVDRWLNWYWSHRPETERTETARLRGFREMFARKAETEAEHPDHAYTGDCKHCRSEYAAEQEKA